MNLIEISIILSCSVTTSALLVTLFYGTPLLRFLNKKSSKLEPYYHVKKLTEVADEEGSLPLAWNLDFLFPVIHSCHLRKTMKPSPHPFLLELPPLNTSDAINTVNPPLHKTIKEPYLSYHFYDKVLTQIPQSSAPLG